jgi:hypothetical protein
MVPPTYLVDGEDQEQRPNEFSLEIYLESVPVSRSNQQLLMYSLAEIAV